MSEADLILGTVVVAALVFGFTNGFHDTGDLIAASVSTSALPPRLAVAGAAGFNLIGAFISLAVASTIAEDIVDAGAVSTGAIFAGVAGAIAWNAYTWFSGLPSSSSHALIGGVIGATVVSAGTDAVFGESVLTHILIPALVAPLVAFLVAGVAIVACYRLFGRGRPGPVGRGFRLGQVATGNLLALAHGANDAQKTMGVITLALVANGSLDSADFEVPTWVVLCSAVAISLGTYAGGWRIVRTMGIRMIRMDPAQGFSAQGSGTAVILASTFAGYPISTTQVIAGGVVGAGAGKRLSAVRWGLAGNIVVAWLLTLPAAAAIGALAYGVVEILPGASGPVLLAVAGLAAIALVVARRLRGTAPLTA